MYMYSNVYVCLSGLWLGGLFTFLFFVPLKLVYYAHVHVHVHVYASMGREVEGEGERDGHPKTMMARKFSLGLATSLESVAGERQRGLKHHDLPFTITFTSPPEYTV